MSGRAGSGTGGVGGKGGGTVPGSGGGGGVGAGAGAGPGGGVPGRYRPALDHARARSYPSPREATHSLRGRSSHATVIAAAEAMAVATTSDFPEIPAVAPSSGCPPASPSKTSADASVPARRAASRRRVGSVSAAATAPESAAAVVKRAVRRSLMRCLRGCPARLRSNRAASGSRRPGRGGRLGPPGTEHRPAASGERRHREGSCVHRVTPSTVEARSRPTRS